MAVLEANRAALLDPGLGHQADQRLLLVLVDVCAVDQLSLHHVDMRLHVFDHRLHLGLGLLELLLESVLPLQGGVNLGELSF